MHRAVRGAALVTAAWRRVRRHRRHPCPRPAHPPRRARAVFLRHLVRRCHPTAVAVTLPRFVHLLVKPQDRRVVVVESLLVPAPFRTALCDVLLKHFQVLSVCFVPAPIMATLPVCRASALVVDIGHVETAVLAVCHGFPVLRSCTLFPAAAHAVQQSAQQHVEM